MDHLPDQAHRIQAIRTPIIPAINQLIAEHPGTISLGQGVANFAPPLKVRQAVATAALEDPNVDAYGASFGTDLLLEGLSNKLSEINGLDLTQSTLMVTAGSNMGFLTVVNAICDAGDEVILFSPYYFNHEMAIELAGAKAVIVRTDENHQPDLAALEAAFSDKTRAVVTVSPCNPTGVVYHADSLIKINELCARSGVFHVSDEAYEHFVYNGKPHFSPGSLPNAGRHTVSLFSFSKSFGMAGWRVGYMVAPAQLEAGVKKFQDTNLICAPAINQVAAAAALRLGNDWCLEKAAGYTAVRDVALSQLSALGSVGSFVVPDGAFYIFVTLNSDKADTDIVQQLVIEHGVAVLPGSSFGAETSCSLRVAYGALDSGTVSEGVSRLVSGLKQII